MRILGACARRCSLRCLGLGAVSAAGLAAAPGARAAGEPVQAWLTTVSGTSLVNPMAPQSQWSFGAQGTNSTVVTVDPTTTFQTIDGFGGALTDSAAWLIANSPDRN